MTPSELRAAWPSIEPQLQVGDIILTHERPVGAPIPRLIQELTDSYWSHSALVFATSDMLPLGGTILVESESPYGVRMHNIKRYADNAERFDIGVLRYPHLKDEGRVDFVRAFMASMVDVPYDTVNVVRYGLARMAMKWLKRGAQVTEFDPSRFHCSTFAHMAVHAHSNNPHPRDHAYSPADLVRGGEFTWVFNQRV